MTTLQAAKPDGSLELGGDHAKRALATPYKILDRLLGMLWDLTH